MKPPAKRARQLLAMANGPRVLVNSVPKAGTHLLLSALQHFPALRFYPLEKPLATGQEETLRHLRRLGRGQVIQGHIPHDPEVASLIKARKIRTILVVRDPRDYAVSLAHYIAKQGGRHRFGHFFEVVLKCPDDRLLACIEGIPAERSSDGRALPGVGARYRAFLPWASEDGVLLCRFEDLVGERGGGSRERQVHEIGRVAAFLGIGLSDGQIGEIAQAAFSTSSTTFRKGAIGDWKNHFKESHKESFREAEGGLLSAMGYEPGDDW